jgi:hypothetical protein
MKIFSNITKNSYLLRILFWTLIVGVTILLALGSLLIFERFGGIAVNAQELDDDGGGDGEPGDGSSVSVDSTVNDSNSDGTFDAAVYGVSTGDTPLDLSSSLGISSTMSAEEIINSLLSAGFEKVKEFTTALGGTVTVFDNGQISVGVYARAPEVSTQAIMELKPEALRDYFFVPPDTNACLIFADPTFAVSPPLTTLFKMFYTTSTLDCAPPQPQWDTIYIYPYGPPPCEPVTGCYATFTSPGIYGPYRGVVKYSRWIPTNPPICAQTEGFAVRCRSPQIRVGTPGCTLTATPTQGQSPLSVTFNLQYTNTGCQPPRYYWSTKTAASIRPMPTPGPCTLTNTSPNSASCSTIYSRDGTYGPYQVTVEYFEENQENFTCGLSQWVTCESYSINVGSWDFAITNSGDIVVERGGTGSNVITATLATGTPQALALSISALPAGLTAQFSPQSGTPTFSSTLTINADVTAATGTYPVTVTGTSGSIIRNTAFNINVTSVPVPSPSPSPPPSPPAIISFTATPNPILRNQSSTLNWSSSNTTSCSGSCISGDCNEWVNTSPPGYTPPSKPTSGSQPVSPATTATYQLSCIGSGGSATAQVTITVRFLRWREIIPRLFPFLNRLLGLAQ